MLTITEFCLQGEPSLIPFAVLVEGESECHWAIATGAMPSPGWPEHVAESKKRRAVDAWSLDSWNQWLSDIAQEPPEARQALVKAVAASTPGVVVRRPRSAKTSLTARVVAKSWETRRLHDRAESLAARIARRLSKNHIPHWSSKLQIDDAQPINGDWIVECQPRPGRLEMREPPILLSKNEVTSKVSPKLVTTAAEGLAVIRVIDAEQVTEVISEWERQKTKLGIHHAYGIAVVRKYRGARVTDAGCVAGDRFAAAESLATAATRAAWTGAFPLIPASYKDGD